jgi:spermidine synthase
MTNASDSIDGDDRWRGAFPLIATCFLLSGFAALLYETVWLRQFAIILGTSEQALAVILASYMGGLSAGAWVASRRIDRVRHPVWLYGVLEAGIALCAIAMPWGLQCVEFLQVLWFGGSAEPPAAGSLSQILFGLASTFILIMLPTAMMGATLPLLAKHVVHRNRDVGPKIGLLYGINTFGAVAGTLTAAFVLLPNLGLMRTTWVGAAVNLGIFALVYVVVRRGSLPLDSLDAESESAAETEADSTRFPLVLWFAAAAGAVAFCYEIIFTRMLSHLLGGSIYAFATMLAGFLLGIALGGTIASRFAIRRDRSVIALVYAQSLAGASALLAYHLIDVVAGWPFADWGGSSATFSQVVVSILILVPSAIFMGATFPLATRIFARDQSEAASGSARVYFFNTIGAIAGALFTGIFLLPSFAYHGSTSIAILINACLAIVLVWIMRVRLVHLAAGVLTIVLLACFAPAVPERLMRVSALNKEPTEGKLIFSRVGRSGTVALFDQQGDVRFQTNGLPEAIVTQTGTRINPFSASGAWLSALPPLLRNDCDSMLIIGLGGGVAAAHVPPSVDEIDIFELEPAVVEANRFIGKRRDHDPLVDRRVKIILNDGRNGLALTSKKYDAIVSQPSHPWTAGASHLYTREFAETASARLNPGGIFLQWMNTGFVNPDLFRSLAATLLDVFPHVRVYEPSPDNVLFVASDEPIRPEAVDEPTLELDPRDQIYYEKFGLQTPTHLFALLRIDEPTLRELAKGAALITDEYNVLALQAPYLLSNSDTGGMKTFLDEHAAYNQAPEQIRENCPTLNPSILGLRLFSRDFEIGMDQIRALSGDASEAKLYQALIAKKENQNEQWAQLLSEVAAEQPNDPRPAFLLLAHNRLGTSVSLPDDMAQELLTHLDDRYSELLAAVDAISRNDPDAVRQREQTLASFDVDEIGYALAVRMRLLWRITDSGPNLRQSNRDALDLIAQAIPVLGEDALIPFRVAAAIGGDQPDIALASTVAYAKGVVERIRLDQVTDLSQLQSLRKNLIKCRDMVGQRNAFRSIPKSQYSDALEYLDKVIEGKR